MSESILNELKLSLGLSPNYNAFDHDLLMHVNSVLSDLHQLGVGPKEGFEIKGPTATWSDFLGEEPRLNSVKSYVYLRVKMLFDPPPTGYAMTAFEKMIEKAEWRINVAQEEVDNPTVGLTVIEPDLLGDMADRP